jgi:peptidoglycan/xylan/chitin deacetylase (PgdA/CDA1 family)
MMSRSNVLEARSHEIGVHSFSHESMGFESDAFFAEDLERCKEFFQQMGLPLRIYAFPNGSYRPAQLERLLQEGFERVLLVEEKTADLKSPVVTRFTYHAQTASEARVRGLGFT